MDFCAVGSVKGLLTGDILQWCFRWPIYISSDTKLDENQCAFIVLEALKGDYFYMKNIHIHKYIHIIKYITIWSYIYEHLTYVGLVYLHQKNIVHRDVKCANMLLTQECQPKIGDMSL